MAFKINKNFFIISGLILIFSVFQSVKAFEYFKYEEPTDKGLPPNIMGETALMKGDIKTCNTKTCLELKAKIKKVNRSLEEYTAKLNNLVDKSTNPGLSEAKKKHKLILEKISTCTDETKKKQLKSDLNASAQSLLTASLKASPQIEHTMNEIKLKKIQRDKLQRLLRNAASIEEWHKSGLMKQMEELELNKDTFYKDATQIDLEK